MPSSLKCLTFGESFDQSMSGVTLPSLEELTFGLEFNQSLSNLPSSLQELRFNQFHIRIHDMKHRAEG